MAAKVIDKIERKPQRELTFYMPWEDKEVASMLIRRDYKRVLKESQDWDFAVFGGGADICPMLYGEKALDCTYMNIHRDLREISFFKSLHPKRLKVGICRGAQLLNVLSGGRLWQDVNNHAVNEGHEMSLYHTSATIKVSSRHHQMMIVTPDAWIMGASREATRKVNQVDGKVEITLDQLHKMKARQDWPDPEVVYYGNTNSLCFQPHPEDDGVPECTEFFFECLESVWSEKDHEDSCKEW